MVLKKFENTREHEKISEDRIELMSIGEKTMHINLYGEKIGIIRYKDCRDYYSVSFITINENMRGKGIGEIIYKKLANSFDKPLRSDIRISELAENFWQKLIARGLAKQMGNIASGIGLYEYIK